MPTAKTFRTWAGTVLAAQLLHDCTRGDCPTQIKRQLNQVIAAVAQRLGNTRAVCRKCYIHPAILNGFTAGTLQLERTRASRGAGSKLRPEERAVLRFLRLRSSPSLREAKLP